MIANFLLKCNGLLFEEENLDRVYRLEIVVDKPVKRVFNGESNVALPFKIGIAKWLYKEHSILLRH